MALYQVFDAIAIILRTTLSGAGDTTDTGHRPDRFLKPARSKTPCFQVVQ